MKVRRQITFFDQLELLPLIKISPASFYDFTDDFEFNSSIKDSLKKSIETFGILSPLTVLKPQDGENFILLSGRRRLICLNELGSESAPCRIVKEALLPHERLLLFICDNISHRDFSLFEIAGFVSYLSKHITDEELIRDALPLLKINPSLAELDKIRAWEEFTMTEIAALKSRALDFKAARENLDLNISDRNSLADLYISIKPTVSEQRIFSELLRNISRRERCSFAEILTAPELARMLENHKTTSSQKRAMLRNCLEKKRNPKYSEIAEKFEKTKKQMKLPGGSDIAPSQYFEGEDFVFSAKFKNKDDLKKVAAALLKSAEMFDFHI